MYLILLLQLLSPSISEIQSRSVEKVKTRKEQF